MRDVFEGIAGADSTAIFIVIPVKDVMTAISDTPVTPVSFKNTLGVGLDWGAAGTLLDNPGKKPPRA